MAYLVRVPARKTERRRLASTVAHIGLQKWLTSLRSRSRCTAALMSRYRVRWVKPDGSDAKKIITAYLRDENQQRSQVGPL